jgi:hypothetical protein
MTVSIRDVVSTTRKIRSMKEKSEKPENNALKDGFGLINKLFHVRTVVIAERMC